MKNKKNLSIEDTFDNCVKHKLTTFRLYKIFSRKNKDCKLHSAPNEKVNKTIKEYFTEIREAIGIDYFIDNDIEFRAKFTSIEDTFEICVKNNLISSPIYNNFRKENKRICLYSNVYIRAGKTSRDYFKEVREAIGIEDYVNMSIEDTFKLCVDKKLVSYNQYYDFVLKNKHLKLNHNPHRRVGKTSGEYFREVRIALDCEIMSCNKTFDLCVKESIVSGYDYLLFRNKNKSLNLHSMPNMRTGETSAQYFSRVRNAIKAIDKIKWLK